MSLPMSGGFGTGGALRCLPPQPFHDPVVSVPIDIPLESHSGLPFLPLGATTGPLHQLPAEAAANSPDNLLRFSPYIKFME